jgi:hypothetical protein
LGETHPTSSPEEFRTAFTDFSRRFQERNKATAALMPPEQAKMFMQIIEEEDDICFEEHQGSRDRFYQRLGLSPTGDPTMAAHPTVVYHRQGLGEMAVRTAVRATLWELIFSWFRR